MIKIGGVRLEAFEQAWALLKTDMKLPRPHDVPKFTDPHANLAVYGSLNPYWQQYPDINFETFDESPEGVTGFVESLRREDERRKGLRIDPADSPWKYDVGDFSENLKEGENPDGFVNATTAGVGQVYDELERASVVEAINDAGIFDENEIARVLDEWYHVEGLGLNTLQMQGKTKEMKNKRGYLMNRVEDFHGDHI